MPICAPGMAVFMAAFAIVGGRDAVFAVTPIAAGLLVWCAFVLAARMAGRMAGAVAAVLVAASPIVLFQAVQPMNDILTATLWTAAFVAATWESDRRTWVAGALAGLAILVRPNLAPLGLVVASLAFTSRFFVASLPGVFGMFLLNDLLYGHPFASGYGSALALFDAANVGQNLRHYLRVMNDTETVVLALALLAPFLLDGFRRVAWTLLGGAAAVLAFYAFYQPFSEWWYVRFLIPAIVWLIVLASAAAVDLGRRLRMGGVIAIATVVIAILMVTRQEARDARNLQQLESRYRESAQVVRNRLPANAILITVWQSGSMRFHAGRDSVMWDSLDPAWLDRAVEWLRANGRSPYILVERREEPDFRARFRGRSPLGALDWPPRFDLDRQVRIFDPADRARFQAGEAYSTENVGTRRR